MSDLKTTRLASLMNRSFNARSVNTVVGLGLAVLLLIGSPAMAASVQSLPAESAVEVAQIVEPAVLDALSELGQADIRIVLADPSKASPGSDAGVSPLIVDLVSLLSGHAELDAPDILTGSVDEPALMALLQYPDVLRIELDPTPNGAGIEPLDKTFVCIPSTTAACLSYKFRVLVNGPFGPFARVAAKTSQSAAYYFANSANWEVLVKVLDGCGVNNHYWVFAGKATSQNYSISVTDVTSNQTRVYGASCPLIDTRAFPCS